jgi:hypothetical protein
VRAGPSSRRGRRFPSMDTLMKPRKSCR